jgi:Cu/Ag efflux protein CusF
MKILNVMLASAAALTLVSSAALAEEALTGTIIGLNRLDSTITIQRTQNGTVGANAGGAAEQFKVKDGLSLDDVHAGNKVTFSATDTGGTKTITKLQKQ